MADKATKPRPEVNTSTRAEATSSRPNLSPLRHRPLARASTFADVLGPRTSSQPRRRSSFMTNDSAFSTDGGSLKSATDDLFLPRPVRDGKQNTSVESSHIHSLPLALAILPAIGGALFSGGSQVITDITLLVLASIFLNWSVRLPWDWYHSAQQVQIDDGSGGSNGSQDDGCFPSTTTIIEEDPLPIHSNDSKSPKAEDAEESQRSPSSSSTPRPRPTPKQTSATTELRLHELLALFACFVSPLLGAYILHTVRGQLSRPSEGLVSDYNLSIFILAAELRPLSHLIKMILSRTLHLQRLVAENPHVSQRTPSPETIQELQTRLDELEIHVANNNSAVVEGSNGVPGLSESLTEKSAQQAAKKALQPDLDALTRAIRRYEKRATLLGLQTESRLNDLESRLRDALTLAAGAERAANRRGLVGTVADTMAWCIALPGNIVSFIFASILGLLRELWTILRSAAGLDRNVKAKRDLSSRIGRSSGSERGKERRRKD